MSQTRLETDIHSLEELNKHRGKDKLSRILRLS